MDTMFTAPSQSGLMPKAYHGLSWSKVELGGDGDGGGGPSQSTVSTSTIASTVTEKPGVERKALAAAEGEDSTVMAERKEELLASLKAAERAAEKAAHRNREVEGAYRSKVPTTAYRLPSTRTTHSTDPVAVPPVAL